MQLARSHHHVLARLFHARRHERIGFADGPQTGHHLGQFTRIQRFHSNFDNRLCVVLQWSKDGGFICARVSMRYHRASLDNAFINARQECPRASRHFVNCRAVARLRHPHVGDVGQRHVFGVVDAVVLAEYAHTLAASHRAAHDTRQRVKRRRVVGRIEFGDVQQQWSVGVALCRRLAERRVERAAVPDARALGGSVDRRRHVFDAHVDKAGRFAKQATAHQLEQRFGVVELLGRFERRLAELGERGVERVVFFADDVRVHFVERLEHKLHERARCAALRRTLRELARARVIVDVGPEAFGERAGVERVSVRRAVDARKRVERERPAVLAAREQHVAELWREARRRAVAVVRVGDQRVHLVDRVTQLVVGVGWRQLQLENESVELADAQRERQFVCQRLFDGALGADHHALDGVHHQHHAVRKRQTGRGLASKVDVPGRVHDVHEIGFVARRRQHERHRRHFDAHAALLFQLGRVCVSRVFSQRPFLFMCLLYQHIHECCFAVMQMTE
mmetsp:Transcript_14805/g.25386  ORF Transcript_14805/g.25386 Transcript_14805/m.25386 type:complete len:508 (-) Transcript_14805:22-1545(-)